ncbi:MAG: hypothetical protein QOK27_716 [Gemmatimonadales bacterium]|nr:hypothetical protein [Gemmatimonadales bacterium]
MIATNPRPTPTSTIRLDSRKASGKDGKRERREGREGSGIMVPAVEFGSYRIVGDCQYFFHGDISATEGVGALPPAVSGCLPGNELMATGRAFRVDITG